MLININNLKIVIWFFTIIFLAFAFPIQVFFKTPLPSLIPYVLLLILIFLEKKSIKLTKSFSNLYFDKIHLFIIVYLLLVVIHTVLQLTFNVISIKQGIQPFVIFFLPVFFYIYLYNYTNHETFKIMIYAIIICGLISGIYFLYDSWMMLVEKKVSNFSFMIADYQNMRADGFVNSGGRTTIGYRSHGMLSTHSVSASWASFSCFRLLASMSRRSIIPRMLVITFFAIILLFTMNFTSIVAFSFVMILFEFKIIDFFKIKISLGMMKKVLFILFFGIVLSQLFIKKSAIFDSLNDQALMKMQLLDNSMVYDTGEKSYIESFFLSFLNIFDKSMTDFPIGILVGDGFSVWGSGKGGDFGYSETLSRFGIPFYFLMMFGFFFLIRHSIKKITDDKLSQNKIQLIIFCSYTLMYILLNEIHYSIWCDKSILPLLFMILAIYNKTKFFNVDFQS